MALGLNDLSTVLDELYDIRDKWYFLGLQLKVAPEKLESLTSHDQDSCFCQVLVDWLKSGVATWLALCEALSHKTVGHNETAIKLQTKYSAGKIDIIMISYNLQNNSFTKSRVLAVHLTLGSN